MRKETRESRLFITLCISIIHLFAGNVYATSTEPATLSKVQLGGSISGSGEGSGSGSGTITPDMFTGTMSYSIPIEVPAGRKGMQPNLALTYRSNNGNGWIGVGWDLEIGAIERSARNGINYGGDDFVLRMAGSAIDLISIGNNEYRAKIEGGFTRVMKQTGADGKIYWIATDKTDIQYFYGQTTASRQDNPASQTNDPAYKIFKWCLDKVQDTNGNYMTISYSKDQGQIYPQLIEYTGNGALLPTNYVKFYLEDRTDSPAMYSTNFFVKTAKRLKTIEVRANKNTSNDLLRVYKLVYDADTNTTGEQYSASTGRSLVSSIQQFGKDATLDPIGNINNAASASKLPANTFTWFNSTVGWTRMDDLNAFGSSGYVDGNRYPIFSADINGDGKADICRVGYYGVDCYESNGNGGWSSKRILNDFGGNGYVDGTRYPIFPADINGDGKTDICRVGYYGVDCYESDGNGGWSSKITLNAFGGSGYVDGNRYPIFPADVNGDGKTDICRVGYYGVDCYESDGNGGWSPKITLNAFGGNAYADNSSCPIFTADINGDGKTDICRVGFNGVGSYTATPSYTDLLNTLSNGLGAVTTISYESSTRYQNTSLPFPIQTVSSVSTDDGNGIVSKTTYTYSGGYYHIGEHDFRGFNHVKVTGPAGPSGEQRITETWFHQGNETGVLAENLTLDELKTLATVTTGYMKGKPYRTKVTDAQGRLYSETTTSYASDADGAQPYFNPPLEVNASICDGDGVCGRQTKSVFTFDHNNGNVLQEEHYGNLSDSTDDRTIVRTFSPNTTAWILNKPTNESVYSGVTGTTLTKISSTDYYYDGVTDCNTASATQMPDKGNLTRIVRWLDGGINPEVRMAYDAYGNLSCTRDARGYTTTLGYDSSFTFQTSVANPLGHQGTTKYYGVNNETGDGLYGQVKSVADPNGATTTMTYDSLGRKLSTTAPDGTSTNLYYSPLGTVNSQHVRVDTSVGISTWTYFDGFGRTIKEEKTGPDNKTIVTETKYNAPGNVSQSSLPYFKNSETARWTNYSYDPIGRVVRIENTYDNPPTRALNCYNDGVMVLIDAQNNLKRETKNAQGKLVKVEEFLGSYADCSATPGSPYAITVYQYDVMGNLRYVTDAEGNKTEMHYDTLGRKDYMRDPDMGYWTYTYDANGNLATQTDAKNQTITFSYDEINRVTRKHYPSGTDVVYAYDVTPDPGIPTVPIGRLSQMSDASGVAKFFYDNMGRTTKTITAVDGINYPIDFMFTLGRLTSVRYPDSTVVNYEYNGSNLQAVKDNVISYATYSYYNALGQPGSITYGNGVTTTYQYFATNNHLQNIKTAGTGTLNYLDLTYSYYNNGNISGIRDNLDNTRSQIFDYDNLNRLIQAQSTSYGVRAYFYDQLGNFTSKEGVSYSYGNTSCAIGKPHAVKTTSDGKTYCYDDNGNMTGDGQRTIVYDYDNMPVSVTMAGVTTSFVYDGAGNRVKKTLQTGGVIYIGKFYEWRGGTDISKYIFAGNVRIAKKAGNNIYYYHQDHLNSTRIITDGAGNKIEDNYYYPFGAQMNNNGTGLSHKFTSQEFDPETGLYFYGARYYNPVLGRFISPDTMVPDPANPQSLNRYSYATNNPLRYVDPTGHFRVDPLGLVSTIVGIILVALDTCVYYTDGGWLSQIGATLIAYGINRMDPDATVNATPGTVVTVDSNGDISGGGGNGGGSGGGGGGNGGGVHPPTSSSSGSSAASSNLTRQELEFAYEFTKNILTSVNPFGPEEAYGSESAGTITSSINNQFEKRANENAYSGGHSSRSSNWSMNAAELFAKVEMSFEPYVVAGGLMVGGAVTTSAGVITTVTGYGSVPATGLGGLVVGTAGLAVTGAGVSMLTVGLDIYVDQLRSKFSLPTWFDVIPAFNLFPPH